MADTLRTLVAVDHGARRHEIANTVTSDGVISVVGVVDGMDEAWRDAPGQLVRRARRRLPGLLRAGARR